MKGFEIMKKNYLQRIAVATCGVLLVGSLAACAPTPTKEAPQKSPSQEQQAEKQKVQPLPDSAPAPSAPGKYESVEAWLDSPMIKKQLNTDSLNTPGSGIVLEIIGEGNTLVYVATIEDDALAQALDATMLAAGLEGAEGYYTSLAATIRAAVDVKDPSVEVRYVNNAGDVLYSQVFTAEAV